MSRLKSTTFGRGGSAAAAGTVRPATVNSIRPKPITGDNPRTLMILSGGAVQGSLPGVGGGFARLARETASSWEDSRRTLEARSFYNLFGRAGMEDQAVESDPA